MDNPIIIGDALEALKTLENESVHCVVTSPPYWGLRNYKVDGMIGLEPQFKDWLDKMVEVCGEVKRVLRSDGTFWLNCGDAYASTSIHGKGDIINFTRDSPSNENVKAWESGIERKFNSAQSSGLKPKDLLLMPSRLAIALQDAGWYVRSEIVWAKPNPMPESVTDRPTSSHEKIFLLTKSERYFADMERVREKQLMTRKEGKCHLPAKSINEDGAKDWKGEERYYNSSGRNLRNVWQIATEPNRFAMCPDCHKWYDSRPLQCACGYHGDKWGGHYAAFPKELARRCIKIGTSERGCCPTCSKQWVRVVEKGISIERGETYDGKQKSQDPNYSHKRLQMMCKAGREAGLPHDNPVPQKHTIGFRPACTCKAELPPPIPQITDPDYNKKYDFYIERLNELMPIYAKLETSKPVILDPFAGSGTTHVVALSLGCDCISIELNPDYAELIKFRIAKEENQMKLEFAYAENGNGKINKPQGDE